MSSRIESEPGSVQTKSVQKGRIEHLSGLEQIHVDRLCPFPDMKHVFNPLPDEKLSQLMESIKTIGLIEPPVVWKDIFTVYVISGWNRVEVVKALGHEFIPVIERNDLTRGEAQQLFIESNLIRRELTTAEKAQAAMELKRLLKDGRGKKRPKIIIGVRLGDEYGETSRYSPRLHAGEESRAQGTTEQSLNDLDDQTSEGSKSQGSKIQESKPTIQTPEQAAKKLGVTRRQFDELAEAGSAPQEVASEVGEGFTVREAATVSRAMKNPSKREEVSKRSSQYAKAKASGSKDAAKKAKSTLLQAAKGEEEASAYTIEEGRLRAAYDPKRKRVQVHYLQDPTPLPVLTLHTNGLDEFSADGIQEALDLALLCLQVHK